MVEARHQGDGLRQFFERIRFKDLVAVAAVSTMVAAIFLALGLVWRSAGFALMSAAFWFGVWKTAKTPTAESKALGSKNSDA